MARHRSTPRRPHVLAAVAAAVAVGAVAWVQAGAGAASTLEVVSVVSRADTATVVLGVRPPPTLVQPGVFTVEDESGEPVRADARAVVTPQLTTAVVMDTSAAGAGALQAGVNGATAFLMGLPDGVGSTVVADGGDRPTVLAPLSQGATSSIGALSSVRPDGDRHPADALTAALAGLPAAAGRPRLLLLYTGAADAGGEPADALVRRLQDAGVLLAVVAAEPSGYWSRVATATGGLAVPARGLPSFDEVAQRLRERFLVTVPRPAALPASVEVSVRIGTAVTSRTATLPADAAVSSAPPAPDREPGSAPWWIAGVLAVAVLAAGAVLLARRWAHAVPQPEDAGTDLLTGPPASGPPASGPRGPRTRPAPAVERRPAGADLRPAATVPEPAATPPAQLPRRRPGASASLRHRPLQPMPDATVPRTAPHDGTPIPNGTPAHNGIPVEDGTAHNGTAYNGTPVPSSTPVPNSTSVPNGTPVPNGNPVPDGNGTTNGTEPAAGRASHPAADQRAYTRLDDETATVAALVAEGRLDPGHAVARIALSAPGRVDLVDRVLGVERRLAGAALGGPAPSDTVLTLLSEVRRVVTGEAALVAPDGGRVEQIPATAADGAPVLALTRDGHTREFRRTADLAQHVDLAALTAETAAQTPKSGRSG